MAEESLATPSYSAYLYQPVHVELDDGTSSHMRARNHTTGNMYTVDPVSGDIILAKFGRTEEDKVYVKSFELIPGSSVANVVSMHVVTDSNALPFSDEVMTILDEFFNDEATSTDSEKTIRERGMKIIDYLKTHHIEVAEKSDGVFLICGIVRFEKPYNRENLYCDIPIVLQRILKLIDQIE